MIGARAVLSFLSSSSSLWSPNTAITILNVGSSSGLSSVVKTWANDRHWDVRLSETNNLNDPKFLQAQQFDYVVADGVLDGKSEDEVQGILIAANRLAKRGLAFTDGLRWVRRGFTIGEIRAVAEKAGLRFATVRPFWGVRFLLSGERGLVLSTGLSPAPDLAGA